MVLCYASFCLGRCTAYRYLPTRYLLSMPVNQRPYSYVCTFDVLVMHQGVCLGCSSHLFCAKLCEEHSLPLSTFSESPGTKSSDSTCFFPFSKPDTEPQHRSQTAGSVIHACMFAHGTQGHHSWLLQAQVTELLLQRFQDAKLGDLPALLRFLLQHVDSQNATQVLS